MYLFVLTSRKKTSVASFRQGRTTTTSFAHRNAPFPVKQKMIDARTAGAGSVCMDIGVSRTMVEIIVD